MRPIKFRAYDKKQKRWLTDLDSWFTFDYTGSLYLYNHDDTNGGVDPVLMQFTGLKDKNGVEIYEWDILLHRDKYYLVSWDEQMAAFQSVNVKDKVDTDFFNWGNVPSLQTLGARSPLTGNELEPDVEVIGNIYENEDLLGGVKEDE